MVKDGLGGHSPTGLLGSLPVLGAPHNPHSSTPFTNALIDFLRTAEELQGPMSKMALMLFGATAETRDQDLGVRERAVAEVVWKGKTVTWEAVRRKPKGRRYVIMKHVAQALYDAEVVARQKTG